MKKEHKEDWRGQTHRKKLLKRQLISQLKGYSTAEILSPKEVLGNILKDHKMMPD